MSVRKFYLTNSLNKTYEFTNAQVEHFLNSPQGLGFSKSISTLRLGDEEIKNSEEYSMPNVSGDILFYAKREQAYQDYLEFMDFIRLGGLKLYYTPPNTLYPYYIECEILQVDKTEYDTSGYLSCPVSIYGLTFWQNSQENILTSKNEEANEGKYYPLVRDYYYGGNALSDIQIEVEGQVEIGFVLEIKGNCINPQFVAKQNDITYGKLKLDGTFDYVKIDTNEISENIYLEKDGASLTNPYQYQDLSIADGIASITFFKLKVGSNKLAFSCDNLKDFDGEVIISWKDKRVSI